MLWIVVYLSQLNDTQLNDMAMKYTANQINQMAQQQNFNVGTALIGAMNPTEYKTVVLKPFVTAFFRMEDDFTYTYTHTYNAMNDKTYKRLPKGF